MQRLSEILAVDADAVCVRMTGHNVDHYETLWTRRRRAALLDGKLSGRNLYTVAEREDVMRYYDLAEDDFEPVVVKVGPAATIPAEWRPLDVVTITGTYRAETLIEEHRTTAERRHVSCPPLGAIVLYRITQSSLRHIHAEDRPMRAP